MTSRLRRCSAHCDALTGIGRGGGARVCGPCRGPNRGRSRRDARHGGRGDARRTPAAGRTGSGGGDAAGRPPARRGEALGDAGRGGGAAGRTARWRRRGSGGRGGVTAPARGTGGAGAGGGAERRAAPPSGCAAPGATGNRRLLRCRRLRRAAPAGSRLSSSAMLVNWPGVTVFRLRNWSASACSRCGSFSSVHSACSTRVCSRSSSVARTVFSISRSSTCTRCLD